MKFIPNVFYDFWLVDIVKPFTLTMYIKKKFPFVCTFFVDVPYFLVVIIVVVTCIKINVTRECKGDGSTMTKRTCFCRRYSDQGISH